MSSPTDDKLDQLIDKVDKKFDLIDAKFDSLEEKFDAKFESIDKRFDSIDARFDSLGSNIKIIKHVQGDQSIRLRTIQTDVNSLKNTSHSQTEELTRLGVMFEDFEHKFQAAGELES